MIQVTISDAALRQAAGEGMDAFVGAFVGAIKDAIGGELTAENMQQLNADQVTLLAWDVLHDEVMDGGFDSFMSEMRYCQKIFPYYIFCHLCDIKITSVACEL